MTKDKQPKPKIRAKHDVKIQELIADLQRLQAEFMNYKRRVEDERIKLVQTGKEQAVIALLPVIDNIERAVAHEPDDIKNHAWVQGVTALAKQLDGQLDAIGLKAINDIGESFNPIRHEAVVLEDGDGNTEVIAEVIQTGYQFGDTIIRPAIVKVKRI
ncbi:MAG: nucleotide exchange factor GrpE [Candidatus Saccharibacteria bacterium]